MSTVSGLKNWEAQEEEEDVLSGHWAHSEHASSVQGLCLPEGAFGVRGTVSWAALATAKQLSHE